MAAVKQGRGSSPSALAGWARADGERALQRRVATTITEVTSLTATAHDA